MPTAPVQDYMVDLFSANLDELEKSLIAHAERLDPVLRPSDPCSVGLLQSAQPESRLASCVARLVQLKMRLEGLTERIEA